jgi:hypothetical protein
MTLQVSAGTKRLAHQAVHLSRTPGGGVRITVASTRLPAGDHLLRVSLASNNDAEPRTDVRLHRVTVTPTPGVVLLVGLLCLCDPEEVPDRVRLRLQPVPAADPLDDPLLLRGGAERDDIGHIAQWDL